MRSDFQTVGNDFVIPNKRDASNLNGADSTNTALPKPNLSDQIDDVLLTPVQPLTFQNDKPENISRTNTKSKNLWLINRRSVSTYALLFLLLSVAAMPVAKSYLSANIKFDNVANIKSLTPSSGLNIRISAAELPSWLQKVIGQPAAINYGGSIEQISPAQIKSWLKITPSTDGAEEYVHVDAQAITKSIESLANSRVVTPLNQVTITRADGSSEVAYGGKSGTKLSDPSSLSSQAINISKNLFSANGFQVNAPLVTTPFIDVTASAFHKLLVADTGSKRLYVFQDGQLINTFLSSDGKSSTPTPIGEFHIWAKLTSQTMTGPGYVQPNVPWVNYFDHSGDAVHGVYWRPPSVFGNVNTSHGCVGIPVNDAEWVFNWAPIGTTVITTPN
ncbi:MAG TPA: L,D-transpeptidase [Candidatus Saccharimonadales bacterium]|nr:L,D-transpeptidase [Candidatus Saccharimonadales bacterium]